MKYEIGYGKHEISFYRAHATPLTGVTCPRQRDAYGLAGLDVSRSLG